MSTDDLLDATALVYALLGMTGALEGAHRRMMHRAQPPAAERRGDSAVVSAGQVSAAGSGTARTR